jgi:hypothetical protein
VCFSRTLCHNGKETQTRKAVRPGGAMLVLFHNLNYIYNLQTNRLTKIIGTKDWSKLVRN